MDDNQEPSAGTLKALHREMLRIRRFEERVAELVEGGEARCPVHLYIGQEAVAAGVCGAMAPEDLVWGTHRSHGHYLAKGGDMNAMMAEILGKATGCSTGRGGSMHLLAKDVGILGTVPMVAATIPIAAGAALSARMRGSNQASVAFFGDGAVEEGSFHETLNFASLKKLPVVFVCENNFFSSHLPLRDRQPEDAIYRHGESHGMPGIRIDGNDVAEVFRAAGQALDRARAGDGPTLLECRTYRWRGHVGPNWDLERGIREESEVRDWMARCPIESLEKGLLARGTMSGAEIDQVRAVVDAEVEEAVRFARESPFPPAEDLDRHVFSA